MTAAPAVELVRVRVWVDDGPYRKQKTFTFATGDKVTVEGSPGVWRIKGFMGNGNRIADLIRLDRRWTAATSSYTQNLRPVKS